MNTEKPGTDGPVEMIGLVYDEIADNRASGHVPVSATVLQAYGIVHGGVYSMIAESMCSVATALAVMPNGKIAVGQSNYATFLRPISEGTIHAAATVRHAGRTTWVWDCDITDDDGRLCAMVRMTVAVRSAPEPNPQSGS